MRPEVPVAFGGRIGPADIQIERRDIGVIDTAYSCS